MCTLLKAKTFISQKECCVYIHYDKLTNTNLNIISAQPQDVIVWSVSVAILTPESQSWHLQLETWFHGVCFENNQ